MFLRSHKSLLSPINDTNPKDLDIIHEGALLRKSQDIAEELHLMSRIYNQQLNVVKDFRKALLHMNGEREAEVIDAKGLAKLLLAVQQNIKADKPDLREPERNDVVPQHTIQEADDLLELVSHRQAEIQDLEEAAHSTSRQVFITSHINIPKND
jgi:hypothetical protein